MGSYIRTAFFLFIFSILGCAIGPDYEAPNLSMPTQWRTDPEKLSVPEAASIADLKWWEQFNDPELNRLIEAALLENTDLKIATARVDEFYALYGVTRAPIFPQITGDANFERTRFSQKQTFRPPNAILNDYGTHLNLSWELDIWGRIRRLTEAAGADLLAQEAVRRGVVLTIVSSVAETYIELRSLDRQLAISQDTVKSRMDSLKLMQRRFDAGDISELDVRQAEAEVASTQVPIPALERAIAQRENLLSVLIGHSPGPINRGVSLRDLKRAQKLPANLPSDLLLQRPDLVQAEQDLISSNAQVGAAIAEYFPKISLTGFFGYESNDLSTWLHSYSRTWGFGPGIQAPVFLGGSISYQVDAAKARKEEALWRYKKAVLDALREAEDALVAFKKTGEGKQAKEYQVSVLRKYLELADTRYQAGQSSYLDVLDAQRRLFTSELSLTESQSDELVALVSIFRAFGGGWIDVADQGTQPVP